VLGVLTRSNDIWLSVWDDSSWKPAETATTSATGQTFPAIAVALERLSGEPLAVYAESATSVRYRTWDAVDGWSDEQNGPNIGGIPNTAILDSDPGSDYIMLSVQDDESDLNFVHWNGSSWGAPSELETNTNDTKNQPFAFLWGAQYVDLSVTKIVDNQNPNVGETIVYTISVINNGPSDATGIVILDLLQAGITYLSDTPSQGTYNAETGLWDVGAMADGGEATLQISATVDDL
jgi:uncharacterized repeat protein (TIGR01451 family)